MRYLSCIGRITGKVKLWEWKRVMSHEFLDSRFGRNRRVFHVLPSTAPHIIKGDIMSMTLNHTDTEAWKPLFSHSAAYSAINLANRHHSWMPYEYLTWSTFQVYAVSGGLWHKYALKCVKNIVLCNKVKNVELTNDCSAGEPCRCCTVSQNAPVGGLKENK
jgi:hypothetical protein